MQNAIFGRRLTVTIQALTFIGLSVATVLTGTRAVHAQTPPTLVQNVDEPARNPYQQSVQIEPCNGGCTVQFAAVPKNTTLRITNVSCIFVVGDSGGVGEIYVSNGEVKPKVAFIPAVPYGNAEQIVANAAINLYASAGNKPTVVAEENTAAISAAVCTLSGYYVTL